MLLEPLEEQLELPAALIQLREGQRRHGEVVGQAHECLSGLGITLAAAAQRCGIIAPGMAAGQLAG